MSSSPPFARSSFQAHTVAVYMCDQRKQYDQFITYIPLSVLEYYAPYVCDLIEPDIILNQYRLFIRLPHTRTPNFLIPHPTSVGDAVITYRALQLMLQPEAEKWRGRIMRTLRTRPLTDLDVQTIWWTFQGKSEWSWWLDALFSNLVRFQVLSSQPHGMAILVFVETEMFNMDNAQSCQVLSAYERHVGVPRSCWRTTLSQRVGSVLCRIFHAWS